MKERLCRILAVVMTVVFVNFVFANTVFMHVHIMSDGAKVVHSHPYMPSAHHNHTSQAFEQISEANAASGAMEYAPAVVLPVAQPGEAVVNCAAPVHVSGKDYADSGLRGPPVMS